VRLSANPSAKQTPPADDQLELSLIGPGYGESVVVHVGNGEWVLIDSCINKLTGRPAAIEYLGELGVDYTRQVRLVVASHWHDDHVRGLSQTLKGCVEARFVHSLALRRREYLRLILAREYEPSEESNGVNEMYQVLDELKARGTEPILAGAKQQLWESAGGATVTSLSPSNGSIVRALRAIGKLLPEPLQPMRYVPEPTENHAAVVLWITVGGISLLLGGDLEVGRNETEGWLAVLIDGLPGPGKAVGYKIAHHGSVNADHPQIWSDLLVDDVWALVTPFTLGNVVLPTRDDRTRMCSSTRRAFISSPPRYSGRRRREPRVDKMITELVRELREVEGPAGHIRLRVDLSRPENESVELFGAASSLCN
jgi:hypothetical protein